MAEKVEELRALAVSDDQFSLAPDHSADQPNIRRLRKAVDKHPELWVFAREPAVVDLVADVLGPDLRFHSSKLNFKWSSVGDAMRWHQDIQTFSGPPEPLHAESFSRFSRDQCRIDTGLPGGAPRVS